MVMLMVMVKPTLLFMMVTIVMVKMMVVMVLEQRILAEGDKLWSRGHPPSPLHILAPVTGRLA